MHRIVFEVIGSLALFGIGIFFGTILVSTVAAKRANKLEIEASKIKCFHCLKGQVHWDKDVPIRNVDYTGVIHWCHCDRCGAEIRYTSIVRK